MQNERKNRKETGKENGGENGGRLKMETGEETAYPVDVWAWMYGFLHR